MIELVGELVNQSSKAKFVKNSIQHSFLDLKKASKTGLYLIWNKPYMVAASDTFIDSIMNECGIINHFKNKKRYPEITIEDLTGADYCFMSSEPFPFDQKHIQELQGAVKNCQFVLVDGEMFSWYGSRLIKAPQYFQKLQKQIQEHG